MAGESRAHSFPLLTAAALALSAAGTLTRLAGTGVFDALRRDPSGLRRGQLWRLITPVLVQSDRSHVVVIEVFVLCAVVGAIGERVFARPEWLAPYLTGALVGHGIGEAFQPYQSGMSVAFAGILGGLAAEASRPGAPVPKVLRVEAALLIPLAIIDTALRDIHGAPLLGGFVVAYLWRELTPV
jgi:membrane associated rhomboid family serine protease